MPQVNIPMHGQFFSVALRSEQNYNTMINIGDKVKFLNATGGGTVTAFQSKKVAVVEDHDGFEIPVLISELVRIDETPVPKNPRTVAPQAIAPTPPIKKEIDLVPAPTYIEGNDEPRFFMAFLPSDQNNHLDGEIEIFLINDSNLTILFHYTHHHAKGYTTIEAGELAPNTKTCLESISRTDFNDLPGYHFSILPFKQENQQLTDCISKEIKVHPQKFYKEKSFTKNNYFAGKALLFDLVTHPMSEAIGQMSEQDFKAVIEAKDKAHRPPIQEKEKVVIPENLEVDLHIEQLMDQVSGLSNHEILEIQMKHFHDQMQWAINNKVKRIIFIHGVGNGVLKQEIHRKLKSTYAKYYFQDASFQEYGYGATLVILKRN